MKVKEQDKVYLDGSKDSRFSSYYTTTKEGDIILFVNESMQCFIVDGKVYFRGWRWNGCVYTFRQTKRFLEEIAGWSNVTREYLSEYLDTNSYHDYEDVRSRRS